MTAANATPEVFGARRAIGAARALRRTFRFAHRTSLALAAAFALALGGCSSALLTAGGPPAALPQSPRQAALETAPTGRSQREHERILAAYNGAYDDPKLEALLHQTVAKLIAASERPDLQYRITILNSHEIIEQTMNWILDFGLVEGDPATLPPGIETQVFARDELVLVVAPAHRWSGLNILKPEMLREKELLLREQGSGIREVIEHALLQQNVRITPLLTLPDNEVIKQMAMSGVGAAILSAFAVRRELASNELVRIPIEGIDLRPQLTLVKRSDKHLPRAAQAFCSLLQHFYESETTDVSVKHTV